MRFQIALTSDHVIDFRWVPFSELEGPNKKERRRILVNISPPTSMSGGVIILFHT